MKKRLWTYCNELNGKEWIPDDTVPGKPGWYEDVPRRLYVGTPWLFFTFDRDKPWLDISRRRKDPVPRRSQLYLVVKELGHTDNAVVAHYIKHNEWGMALTESLFLERKSTEYLDYDVENEVQAMINQLKRNNPLREALQHGLDQFKGVTMRNHRRLIGER